MSMFSGTANFLLMDKSIQNVLNCFFNKFTRVSEQQNGEQNTKDPLQQVTDLREEIKIMFEKIVTIFVFGKDVSEQKVKIKNINYDGSV